MTEDKQAIKEPETTILGQLKKKSHEELLLLLQQLLERDPNIEPQIKLLLELQSATTTPIVQAEKSQVSAANVPLTPPRSKNR